MYDLAEPLHSLAMAYICNMAMLCDASERHEITTAVKSHVKSRSGSQILHRSIMSIRFRTWNETRRAKL